MDVNYLLEIAPKTCLTLLSPFCCLAVKLSFQVYFSRPRSERTVLIQASSGASFLCSVSLFIVIVNYNLLDALSIYALLFRALSMILGMFLNDFVVIMRMRSLSHNMWTSFIVVTIVLCIVKYIGGIMMIVSLITRIISNESNGLTFPVQRLILCGGEMSTSVCFVVFWFRLLHSQSKQSKGKKNEKLTFFIKLVQTNIIFSSVILIVLWGLCILTDWVYNVVFDFLMMPGYFFVLCPSAVISLTKDHQRTTQEPPKGSAVILPVEYN